MGRKKQPRRRILCGRIETLNIHEVSEDELRILEQGGPNSILLNFASFFLSTFLSFLIALMTTTINDERTFIVFVVITAVAAVSTVVLFVLWWPSRESVRKVVQTIRERLPADEGIQETLPPADDPEERAGRAGDPS